MFSEVHRERFDRVAPFAQWGRPDGGRVQAGS